MNIQINCKDNVREEDLRFIYYNLADIIKEYQEDKKGIFHSTYKNGQRRWYKKLKGNMMMSTNIDCFVTPKTIYFKIWEDLK